MGGVPQLIFYICGFFIGSYTLFHSKIASITKLYYVQKKFEAFKNDEEDTNI